jgi:signal transduction histidine kinase
MSAFDANLDRIRHGKAAVTYESWRLRRDGSRIPVSISLAGIQEPGGSLTGFCAVLRDVTPDDQAEAVAAVREAGAPADADHRRIARDLNNCVMSRIFSAWLVARAATNIADPEVARRLTRVIEDLGLAISELRTAISTLRGGC